MVTETHGNSVEECRNIKCRQTVVRMHVSCNNVNKYYHRVIQSVVKDATVFHACIIFVPAFCVTVTCLKDAFIKIFRLNVPRYIHGNGL